MARVMEIFVIVNAACGIAAFVIAKGLINKAKKKIVGDDDRLPPQRR
jgi:hypothetical protein